MKQALHQLISYANGSQPVDLVLKNAQVVNVYSGEIIPGNLAIGAGRFIGMGDYEGTTVIDLQGQYIVPGLIDGHMHIESTMVTPRAFAQAALPHGTTTVISDPHEIANVRGLAGISYMLEASEGLPLDVFVMMPSCVPATPFENSGASLLAEDLAQLMDHPRVLGLGEFMNYPGVIQADEDVLDKLVLAKEKGLLIDGHGPAIGGKALNAYAMGGILTDHECSTPEEMLDRLRLGMYIAIREGTAARNLVDLMPAVNGLTERRCVFCTDDRHPEGILSQGHIDNNVRLAIAAGLDPVVAIRMATLNSAECYGLKDRGAIAPGLLADFLVVGDLETFAISSVYKAGQAIGPDHDLFTAKPEAIPPSVLHTMNAHDFTPADFAIPLTSDLVHVIGLVDHSLVTKKETHRVKVSPQGFYENDGQDLAKIAVIERHKATGNMAKGLVARFGIVGGAIASTVSNDSHNIVVVGDNDHDMWLAAKEVEGTQGGLAVVSGGKVMGSLPLPIAGLMSDQTMEVVDRGLSQLLALAYDHLQVNRSIDPFMTLGFLALPVIPEIKITDCGLFDVEAFDFLPLEVTPVTKASS